MKKIRTQLKDGEEEPGEAYTVPEPVGGGRQGHTPGTDGQRKDLADHDPGTGTPGGSEEEDVNTDEGNHGTDGMVVLAIGHTNDSDNELTNDHTQGTPQEDSATAILLDDIERNRS